MGTSRAEQEGLAEGTPARGTVDEAADPDTKPLGRSAAVGTLWLTGQKWVVRLSGFLTLAILTRLIAPEEFGTVAAAATVTPFVLLLADLGLSTYIVQAKTVDARVLSTGFWFSCAAGIVLSLGLALAAPLIAGAFNIERAGPVLQVMSLTALITVLAAVPNALLRRRMEFRLLALQSTAGVFIAQIVAVAAAFLGAGAWALVAQLLVSQSIAGVLAWRSARWLPSFEFSVSELRNMARFGSQVVAVDGATMVKDMVEAAIIANALGATALGYVNIAGRLVYVAADTGAAALVPVSIVVFAKVRELQERLRKAYLRALRIGYAAVSPILTFVAVAAPLLVPFMFGDGWDASVPVARCSAIAAILVLGAMIDHGLHYATGRPGRWLAYALVIDILTVATTYVLAPHGLVAIALGFMIVALVATIARWFLVAGLVGCAARTLASGFVVSMVPVMVSAAAGIAILQGTMGLPDFVALALTGSGIALVHLAVIRLISRDVLADVLGVLPLPGRLAFIRRMA